MTRVVIDPVTRIEGHLRIEVEVDDGYVTNAWSSCTMWRGIERILQGRDPRDAWYYAQRLCGVCTGIHAHTSVRAVENALGITIPINAVLVRNLIEAVQYIHDHVVHFYHLHALDWVDVVSALQADPEATAKLAASLSDWPKNSTTYFAGIKQRLEKFVGSGQLGPFANGFWGHPAYVLPPEANLMAVAHYLEALDIQRDMTRIHAILGGKNPHMQTFLVGGVALAMDPNGQSVFNTQRAMMIKSMLDQILAFTTQVYIPDVIAIGTFYKDWANYGRGSGNYLVYGDFPLSIGDPSTNEHLLYFTRGYILDGDLTQRLPVDQAKVKEYVAHSWYDYSVGDDVGLHPWQGETTPNYTGPRPPYEYLFTGMDDKYSWLKSPRYDEHPMEVGPLARMLIDYINPDSPAHASVKAKIDTVLRALNVGPEALLSTLGRIAARAIETWVLAEKAYDWYDQLVKNMGSGNLQIHNGEKWNPATWPKEAEGVGLSDAPRGALGHWVRIKDGKIANYQCVVPSTWNAGPRDANNTIGPYEASLIGTPIADPERPVEVLRTIHSFDPCIACAAHIVDTKGRELLSIRVR